MQLGKLRVSFTLRNNTVNDGTQILQNPLRRTCDRLAVTVHLCLVLSFDRITAQLKSG